MADREIKLPADLCASAEKKFGHHFANVEALLEFVLRQLTQEQAAEMDEAEQKLIEARLKELGYL
jgi:hypothetical protein